MFNAGGPRRFPVFAKIVARPSRSLQAIGADGFSSIKTDRYEKWSGAGKSLWFRRHIKPQRRLASGTNCAMRRCRSGIMSNDTGSVMTTAAEYRARAEDFHVLA